MWKIQPYWYFNIWRIVRLFLTFRIFSCLSRICGWANTWFWVLLSICGQGKIAGTVIYSDLTAIGTGKRFLNDPLVILRQCVQRIGIFVFSEPPDLWTLLWRIWTNTTGSNTLWHYDDIWRPGTWSTGLLLDDTKPPPQSLLTDHQWALRHSHGGHFVVNVQFILDIRFKYSSLLWVQTIQFKRRRYPYYSRTNAHSQTIVPWKLINSFWQQHAIHVVLIEIVDGHKEVRSMERRQVFFL